MLFWETAAQLEGLLIVCQTLPVQLDLMAKKKKKKSKAIPSSFYLTLPSSRGGEAGGDKGLLLLKHGTHTNVFKK